jgi:hypothetical protein
MYYLRWFQPCRWSSFDVDALFCFSASTITIRRNNYLRRAANARAMGGEGRFRVSRDQPQLAFNLGETGCVRRDKLGFGTQLHHPPVSHICNPLTSTSSAYRRIVREKRLL